MKEGIIIKKVKTRSAKETEILGEKLAKILKGNEIIALYGDLGAGKTHFTKGLCKGLDIYDGVSSPTFSMVNEYNGKYKIYHFDMYRIKSFDDLYSIGFFDYIDNGILVIEWSENIDSILPENTIKIRFEYSKNTNERVITFESEGICENISC